MKQKKVKWTTLLLMLITASGLQASNSLSLYNKSSTISTYNLSEIKNITFSSGNLLVNKKNATSSSFLISDLAYCNFTSGIITEVSLDKEDSKFRFYPNPVVDYFNIELSSSISKNVKMEIFNIDGKVVLSAILNNQLNSIALSELPNGIYFCRCVNGESIYSSKFIKL